jgi:Zn-dependent protease with chaperone function
VYHFGQTLRERRGLAWWFGSAVVLAGSAGWLAGRLLKAAVSRQREYLADARAVQWTRSRDGLGGVLRKIMDERRQQARAAGSGGLEHPALQHMLLVDLPRSGRWARHLDSHPGLAERVQRIYGRPMQPLPCQRLPVAPEPAGRSTPAAAPGAVPLAARYDPYAG